MLIVPALDLLEGKVVRLHQGQFERVRTYAADPLPLAQAYAAAGAKRLHVIDLDAARGSGDNRALVERIAVGAGLQVQVGGGIRSEAEADRWLRGGATAVIMGTLAVQQPGRLAELARKWPGCILAALDVKAGRPAIAGWQETGSTRSTDLLAIWDAAPLGGVILTSVDRDGTLSGPDLALLQDVRRASKHRLFYSGGVAGPEDLQAIADAGADAVIAGKSLLEARFVLQDAIQAFPSA